MNDFKNPDEVSPTFCVYPWMELILGPTSDIKLCCLAETAVEDESGKPYMLGETSLGNYWNSYGLREVRRKMLNGEKIKACSYCYYQESIGRASYREAFNRDWFNSKYVRDILERVEKSKTNGYRVEKQPLYLDVRPGNLCNLKCRMCTPDRSSKIYTEQKQLLKDNPSVSNSLLDTSYLKEGFYNWQKNKDVWTDIYKWTPGIKQLYFTGGEPTLIKENWEFIDYLQKKGYSKDIHLMFNINCTQAPDKLLKTFANFSTVTITFSVDGYKEANEYIRYPSKWEQIEGNIVKLLQNRRKNIDFHFSPVIQIYNILDLTKLCKWIDELQINYGNIINSLIMCLRPDFLDIAILSKNIKQKALLQIEEYENSYKGSDNLLLECLGAIKNVLKSEEKPDIEEKLKRFYKYTKLLDQHRGNSFEKTFPELNTLLDEDGRWKN